MDKTILYINDEYCLTLEQLKGYFARELKPDTRLYDELLTLQRDGLLADWLQQGSDEEQTLAAKVAELSPDLTNSQLMDELIRTFTGHTGRIDKPHPSTYLELKGVKCTTKDGKQVELRTKVNADGRQYAGDVESNETETVCTVNLAFSFKVKRKDNERFTLQLTSDKGRMLCSDTLSPQGHRVGSTIVVEFNDLTITESGTNFLFTVDGETWASLKLISYSANKKFTINGVDFNMIYVEGDKFTMGATKEQGHEARDNEKPAHDVVLSNFYIGETPVTQELWISVMGGNPSNFKSPQHPVENVSWNACEWFISRLNDLMRDQLGRKRFHLPTEAQWEFAARGGKKSKHYKYAGSNSINDVAWHKGNSNEHTHAVKTIAPNELGLYDMSGNVWEWCQDWYGGYSGSLQTDPTGPDNSYDHVHRGGSWIDSAWGCRVSSRGRNNSSGTSSDLGFRLALY